MKPLCGGDFSRFYLEDNYRTFFERSRPLHDYAISRYKLLYSRYSKGFRVRKFPLQGELPSKVWEKPQKWKRVETLLQELSEVVAELEVFG
jgi:hypothetical protein